MPSRQSGETTMFDTAIDKIIALYETLDLEWDERRELPGDVFARLDADLENFVVRGPDFDAVLELWGGAVYELAWLRDDGAARTRFDAWWRRHGARSLDLPGQPAARPFAPPRLAA